jgi:hypothetical protein
MIEKTETFYCKICFNSYDDKSKIPKVISCGHTMCSQCLEKFISETGNVFNTYNCPFCKKLIKKSFEPIINFEILSSINLHRKNNSTYCLSHKEEILLLSAMYTIETY